MNTDHGNLIFVSLAIYVMHFSSQPVSSYSKKDDSLNDINNEYSHGSLVSDKKINTDSDDENLMLHGELGYILPEQTSFDNKEELVTSKVITTAPPQMTIIPSQAKEPNCHTKAASISSKLSCPSNIKKRNNDCFSETSTFDFEVSNSLKPSTVFKESLTAMSGRVETQSKTDSLEEDTTPMKFLTQPSTTFAFKS